MCVQLMEFLGDTNELAAADVLVFVREAVQLFENLRPLVIGRLLDVFPTIKAMKWVSMGRCALCVQSLVLLFICFVFRSTVKCVSGWGEVICVCVHWFYLFSSELPQVYSKVCVNVGRSALCVCSLVLLFIWSCLRRSTVMCTKYGQPQRIDTAWHQKPPLGNISGTKSKMGSIASASRVCHFAVC